MPLKRFIKRVAFYGNSRYCNICQKSWRTFLPEGNPVREQSRCPWCNSLERHRLTWEFFQRRTYLFDGQPKRVLHVAPERCFVSHLRRKLGMGYVTADLQNPADFQWDITAIPQPDASFDVIYCSHVLEHVYEDRKAMSEFYRVLKPGGWAVLNVPITDEVTFEDPSVTDPAERLRVFGQKDHVRRYGPDYVDRLREAGFQVETVYPRDLFSIDELERLTLNSAAAGEVFYCTK